jgi:hypothetical protein
LKTIRQNQSVDSTTQPINNDSASLRADAEDRTQSQIPYRKEILWHFEAGGEEWAINSISESRDWIGIEETRKNGQVDCHIYTEANLEEGVWKIEVDEKYGCRIEEYFGEWVRRDIEEYLNKHGLPEE